MKEVRAYKRLSIDVNCTVYSNDQEAPARILNICEGGIAIEISREDYQRIDIHKDLMLRIQFVDEYSVYESTYVDEVLVTVQALHSEETEDGYHVGCKLDPYSNREEDYVKYVTMKKAIDFVQTLG